MVVEEVTEEVEATAEADLETASADLFLVDYSVAFSVVQFHLTDTEEATEDTHHMEGIPHTAIIHTTTNLITAHMDIGKQQKDAASDLGHCVFLFSPLHEISVHRWLLEDRPQPSVLSVLRQTYKRHGSLSAHQQAT